MKNIKFLNKKYIIKLHEMLINTYGGTTGIRDEKLLESALKQPESTFEGKFLHDSILKMASAYAYHICKNHAFIDGNKRIAFTTMHIFLERNEYKLKANEKESYKIMIRLTENLTKEELTKWLTENTYKNNFN